MSNCIFCAIASGAQSWTLYEDDIVKAFLDINPASRGHTLIIPKRHCKDITEVTEDELSRMNSVAKKLVLASGKALAVEGFNIISSNGAAAQQDVFHFHIHVIPRTVNDGLNIKYVPLKDKSEDFKETVSKIQKKMSKQVNN